MQYRIYFFLVSDWVISFIVAVDAFLWFYSFQIDLGFFHFLLFGQVKWRQ